MESLVLSTTIKLVERVEKFKFMSFQVDTQGHLSLTGACHAIAITPVGTDLSCSDSQHVMHVRSKPLERKAEKALLTNWFSSDMYPE